MRPAPFLWCERNHDLFPETLRYRRNPGGIVQDRCRGPAFLMDAEEVQSPA
jgi:hypothetical protein